MIGVFETMRVRGGQIPFLERHLTRLRETCTALGAMTPDHDLAARVHEAARASEMVIRVTIQDDERVETRALPAPGAMRTVFSGTVHEPYPFKTTQRSVFDRARSRVVPYRADEAILLTRDGVLTEGCITSVFFWLGTTLCTPSLDLGILPGIGRARLLELAGSLGIAVQEGHFTKAEVTGLPVFLVNSVRGIIETAQHGDWRSPRGDDRTAWLAERFWSEAPVETGPTRV